MNVATTAQHGTLPRIINRYFEVSLYLLVTVGFLALTTTSQLDLFSMVVAGVALAAKALRYRTHPEPELSARTVTVATAFYFVFYLADYYFLSLDFILATVHLVLFVAVIRLYSARSNRDYLWLAGVAFLEILAAAVLTVDTVFLLFFLLFMVLSIATFISFEIKSNLERRGASQTAADGGAFSARLPRTLTLTSWSVALTILFVSSGIFFILPRVNFGYLSAYDYREQQLSGFSSEITLGDIGSIKQDRRVVMRVKQLEGDGAIFQGLRWRGVTMATFDGRKWRRLRGDRYSQHEFSGKFRLFTRPLQKLPSRRVRYRVLREPVSTSTLFVAATPRRMEGAFRHIYYRTDGALSIRRPTPSSISYVVRSSVGVPVPEILRDAPQEYTAEALRPFMLGGGLRGTAEALDAYRQLPELDDRVRELASQLSAPHDNGFDIARAVEQHLRTQYGYTLELLDAPVDDPIAHFLFDRREGHCEYFASSMVILMRTLGIPTRMVNGFLTGEYNEVSGNFIVRASAAHTWVEVFFPTIGWVEFDPTPPDPNVVQPGFWTKLSHYYDAFDVWWDEWVINYDVRQQEEAARSSFDTIRDWVRDMRDWVRDTRRTASQQVTYALDEWVGNPSTLAGIAVVALLGFVFLRRRQLASWFREFRMLRRGTGAELSALESTIAYRRLMRILRRRGIEKLPAQTPDEFASALPPGAVARDVTEFTSLYNRSRFGGSTVNSARMLDILRIVEKQPRSQA